MNSHFDEHPYVKLLEEIGPISVWLIDGVWARKYLQKEFTNFAHHYSKPKGIGGDAFKCIPEDEFWIDQGANPEEIPFFIDHLLVEHYLMSKRGMSYEKAEKEGIKVEERERHRGKIGERRPLEVNPDLRLLQTVGDIQIHLVDGKTVRDKIDPRFCAGGHSKIYGYIPDHPPEIWLDNTSVQADWPFYIIHELHELRDMQMGKEYQEAHKIASRIEWRCRHDPEELLRQQKQLGLI
jgi:hypothetical protein